METLSPATYDSNQYYRFINLGYGSTWSLDVVNPPDGTLFMGPTGPFAGQLWQLLDAGSVGGASGHFYISGYFLGAKMKLDVGINERGDYVPLLVNYTTQYTQTWSLTPHADAIGENRTTWTMAPDFIGAATSGSEEILSVYNDTSLPYLAPQAADAATQTLQRWLVLQDGETIDDPTFSPAHLPALATEVRFCVPTGRKHDFALRNIDKNHFCFFQAPIIPIGQPTSPAVAAATFTITASITPSVTSTSSAATTDSHLTTTLLAATVVPITLFVLAVAAVFIFVIRRRRTLRKLDAANHLWSKQHPYSSSSGRRGGGSTTYRRSSSAAVLSFFESPMERWKREDDDHDPAGRGVALSLLSSNLSQPWVLGAGCGPEESAVAVGNGLSAPPAGRVGEPGSGTCFLSAFPRLERERTCATEPRIHWYGADLRCQMMMMVMWCFHHGTTRPGRARSALMRAWCRCRRWPRGRRLRGARFLGGTIHRIRGVMLPTGGDARKRKV